MIELNSAMFGFVFAIALLCIIKGKQALNKMKENKIDRKIETAIWKHNRCCKKK